MWPEHLFQRFAPQCNPHFSAIRNCPETHDHTIAYSYEYTYLLSGPRISIIPNVQVELRITYSYLVANYE